MDGKGRWTGGTSGREGPVNGTDRRSRCPKTAIEAPPSPSEKRRRPPGAVLSRTARTGSRSGIHAAHLTQLPCGRRPGCCHVDEGPAARSPQAIEGAGQSSPRAPAALLVRHAARPPAHPAASGAGHPIPYGRGRGARRGSLTVRQVRPRWVDPPEPGAVGLLTTPEDGAGSRGRRSPAAPPATVAAHPRRSARPA